MILASAWTLSAQSSTNSINDLSNAESVITIRGRRYVLVPERTFSKVEKLVEEVPALREENTALQAQSENDKQIIAKHVELEALKDKTIEADEKALAAAEKALALEKEAGLKDREAVTKAQARIAELEQKVKKANRRTLYAALAAVGLFFLGGR